VLIMPRPSNAIRSNPPPPIIVIDQIIERDDGYFQLGIGDDAPGPFPTREFALS
jgi:hypothetical protein